MGIKVGKKITLEYFHSKKFPKSLRLKIKNLIETNESSLSDLGTLNKELGYFFSMALNEAIKLSHTKKSSIASVAISGQTIRHEINKKSFLNMQCMSIRIGVYCNACDAHFLACSYDTNSNFATVSNENF